MARFQFPNIETGELTITEPTQAALQVPLNEAAAIDATRDINVGLPSTILVDDPLTFGVALAVFMTALWAPWWTVLDTKMKLENEALAPRHASPWQCRRDRARRLGIRALGALGDQGAPARILEAL
jgi:hypothetical protein